MTSAMRFLPSAAVPASTRVIQRLIFPPSSECRNRRKELSLGRKHPNRAYKCLVLGAAQTVSVVSVRRAWLTWPKSAT
jgi:hypothetical protein